MLGRCRKQLRLSRCMVDIFLDTSVFTEHILGNFSIVKLVNKDRLFSSINVLEETFYKSIILSRDFYLICKNIEGIWFTSKRRSNRSYLQTSRNQ